MRSMKAMIAQGKQKQSGQRSLWAVSSRINSYLLKRSLLSLPMSSRSHLVNLSARESDETSGLTKLAMLTPQTFPPLFNGYVPRHLRETLCLLKISIHYFEWLVKEIWNPGLHGEEIWLAVEEQLATNIQSNLKLKWGVMRPCIAVNSYNFVLINGSLPFHFCELQLGITVSSCQVWARDSNTPQLPDHFVRQKPRY